ncbi:glycoside hydrolase family 6 protein [Nocardioides sp. 1609]|uniref:glycoside hydrolase family 6 protein n=1 Tax=Nocardioides sp. 1609 TaxID=2508327 RepID=UPI00106F3B21|nr:glycoside hydrolase family 6 protein [Nocardioides sp. 1609]
MLPLGPRAAIPLALAALVLGGVSGCGSDDDTADTGGNLLRERPQAAVANPRLEAAAMQATTDGDTERAAVLQRLSDVPTGIWLTPERYPLGSVGGYVSSVVAAGADTVPVFVVYGIPDRDCTGQLSAGGLPAEEYLPWVGEIATAAGAGTVVVLEPDALAGSVSCEGVESRVGLLRDAVHALDDAGVATYVDAGHSDWVPAEEMASLLEEVDVDRARGFATNVANYQPLQSERRYAEQVSDLLGGAHYVVDTSRSGAASATGLPVTDWCNPPGQALGDEPGYVDDGTALDALLWVKPPAESDGTCHGGPPAGEVWIDRAVSLAEAAGW